MHLSGVAPETHWPASHHGGCSQRHEFPAHKRTKASLQLGKRACTHTHTHISTNMHESYLVIESRLQSELLAGQALLEDQRPTWSAHSMQTQKETCINVGIGQTTALTSAGHTEEQKSSPAVPPSSTCLRTHAHTMHELTHQLRRGRSWN